MGKLSMLLLRRDLPPTTFGYHNKPRIDFWNVRTLLENAIEGLQHASFSNLRMSSSVTGWTYWVEVRLDDGTLENIPFLLAPPYYCTP